MKLLIISIFSFCLSNLFGQIDPQYAKPWSYWWWMGSAVDRENISNSLEEFSKAGLGGVHIIPIYGAKGYEDNYLPFLSEDWMEMVKYTEQRANELNLGVDMTLGTGWPFGGSWITRELAAKKLVANEFIVRPNDIHALSLENLKLKCGLEALIAAFVIHDHDTINLLEHPISDAVQDEDASCMWKVQLAGVEPTGQMVKRAAPGGEGLVMDYFNHHSVDVYLNHFDSVFANTRYPIQPRAFYHDSYEVYEANWTNDFSTAFKDQQGYDLLDYFPSVFDTSHKDYPLIVHDIRSTLSELLYSQFAENWTDWCKQHNGLSRYQAHGSPANILDLYALSDIPETESFGCSAFQIPGLTCDPDYEEERFGRPNPLMMKFASSPANLLNKPLVSSETGTWLANHFKVSLRRVKPQVDELFTAGINHIFYHGITYSPEKEGFPGWLFYASTNFGKTSHFWDELPLLNQYVENCQLLLQNANPDNNLLLYFPINDLWTNYRGDILLMLEIHHYARWFSHTSFGEIANLLWNHGYSFDYISDRQVKQLHTDSLQNVFISDKSRYQAIIVPAVEYISESTMQEFERLSEKGVKIIFSNHLPTHYAGLTASKFNLAPDVDSSRFTVSENLLRDLRTLNIPQEELKAKGLDFIRKKNSEGNLYFISNLGNRVVSDTLRLASRYKYLTIEDPLTNESGYIETPDKFYVEIFPGKSFFIQTSLDPPDKKKWHTYQSYDTVQLDHKWEATFKDAGTNGLKEVYPLDSLTSWTEWGDEALLSYAGKARYTSDFSLDNSDSKPKKYLLKIDHVRESARVIVNGTSCGTIWAFPNQLEIPGEILKETNHIEIVVQNLSSNYMRTYDAQNPGWKKFYDINFVDITYNPFDTSNWKLEPSGIIGPVYLVKMK
jgi:hypothetical protein